MLSSDKEVNEEAKIKGKIILKLRIKSIYINL